MKKLLLPLLLVSLTVGSAGEACAFSRGLAAKVRAMQNQAYSQHLTNASNAYRAGVYKLCVQEASLALQQSATDEQAAPAHKLLAAAHTKLGSRSAAAPHLTWLSDRKIPL